MESNTTEKFLRSLGLDNLMITFQENDVNFELLMDASDAELRDLLIEIQVTPGNRLRITKGIERFKAGGIVVFLDIVWCAYSFLVVIFLHENHANFDFSGKTQFDRQSSLFYQREDFRTGIFFLPLH